MADSEKKQLEEKLAVVAQQVLEELKREGVAEDDMEHTMAEADPAWACMVVYKRASSDDSFLVLRFSLTGEAEVDTVARQEIRNQFQDDGNWQHG